MLCFYCLTINVLWLFLAVPWVGLQCLIVVFPDHTHFLLVRIEAELGLKNSTRPLIFMSASGCRASEKFDYFSLFMSIIFVMQGKCLF